MEVDEIIKYVENLPAVLVDYPFEEKKYGRTPVLKHKGTNKWFGIIMSVGSDIYLNVKTDPAYSELLRRSYDYIMPAYHMNKVHWNTIIINKACDKKLVKELIEQSYDLTKKK